MKRIDTLVSDIRDLLEHPTLKRPDRDLTLDAVNGMASAILKPFKERSNGYSLRMSSIGKGIRKHWFESRFGTETPDAESKMRFVMGDIMEEYLFYLAKLTGHAVTHQQHVVNIEGVEGHIDSIIDGHALVDGKTASDNNYKKFVNGLTPEKDEYGYIYQLAGYYQGLTNEGFNLDTVGWLAINKSNSNFGFYKFDIAKLPSAKDRIITIKKALDKDKAPEAICEGAEPKEADNGNKEMSFKCRYCPFKDKCWTDYKVYRYANGDKFFTEVTKPLRVQEVTNEYRT